MKKQFFVGLFAGLLLASAFPAYGAVKSLVGMEVQAENYVIVDGNILGVKAVNIDGTTYSPNRAIADALGMDVKFENQKVYFESKKEQVTRGGDSMNSTRTIDDINLQLKMLNEDLTSYEGMLRMGSPTDEEIRVIKEKILATTKRISELMAEKAELQPRLEEEQTQAK